MPLPCRLLDSGCQPIEVHSHGRNVDCWQSHGIGAGSSSMHSQSVLTLLGLSCVQACEIQVEPLAMAHKIDILDPQHFTSVLQSDHVCGLVDRHILTGVVAIPRVTVIAIAEEAEAAS